MAAAERAELNRVLTICGIVPAANRNLVINEGFSSILDFGELNPTEIENMAKSLATKPDANERVALGTMVVKRLKALSFYIRDNERRGIDINHGDFTANELQESLRRMKTAVLAEKADSDGLNPGPIDIKKWRSWYESFLNYLGSLSG